MQMKYELQYTCTIIADGQLFITLPEILHINRRSMMHFTSLKIAILFIFSTS